MRHLIFLLAMYAMLGIFEHDAMAAPATRPATAEILKLAKQLTVDLTADAEKEIGPGLGTEETVSAFYTTISRQVLKTNGVEFGVGAAKINVDLRLAGGKWTCDKATFEIKTLTPTGKPPLDKSGKIVDATADVQRIWTALPARGGARGLVSAVSPPPSM